MVRCSAVVRSLPGGKRDCGIVSRKKAICVPSGHRRRSKKREMSEGENQKKESDPERLEGTRAASEAGEKKQGSVCRITGKDGSWPWREGGKRSTERVEEKEKKKKRRKEIALSYP